MYAAGHILTSTALAMASSKRLKLDFVKVTTVIILTNLIDLDHLKYYYLDDGTANSLTLHPLHIFSGVVFFLIFLMGLLFAKFQKWAYVIMGGLALHLASDSIAFWLNYNISVLGLIDAVFLIFFTFIARKNIPNIPYFRFMGFLVISEIVASGIQAYLGLVLKLNPQQHVIVYVVTPSIIALTAITFWLIFKKYSQPLNVY
jgi:hypothetical protein